MRTAALLFALLTVSLASAQRDPRAGYSAPGSGGGGGGGVALSGTNTWTGAQTFRLTTAIKNTAPLSGVGKFTIDPRDTPLWQASTTYAVGAVVQRSSLPEVSDYGVTNANNYTYGLFECTAITTGISSGSEPAWDTVGTTVVDGGVTWTRRDGQRRIFEIYDISSAGRSSNVPVAWFDAMGQFKSFRSITLGGTSNGLTGEAYTLWPAMVPNSGSFGGAWLSTVCDGPAQVGFAFNGYVNPTDCWAFQIVDGTPLTPASQKELFAIGRYGGLFWSGTSGGHTLDSLIPDGDTANYTISIQPNTTQQSADIYNGAVAATIGGKLLNNAAAVGNFLTSGPDDLKTYTLPANALNVNTKGLKIKCWGTTANNGNAKVVRLQFGSATVVTKTLKINVAGTWQIEAHVNRVGSNSQDVYATADNNNATALSSTDSETSFRVATFQTLSQTDTSTIVIKCQSTTTTADNDIVQEGMCIEYLN